MKSIDFLWGIVTGLGLGVSAALKIKTNPQVRKEITGCKHDLAALKDGVNEFTSARNKLAASLPAAGKSLGELSYHFDNYQSYLDHKLPRIRRSVQNLTNN